MGALGISMPADMLPLGTFAHQTALVTGGGTGLGFGIAMELARLGARVAIASRKEEVLLQAVEAIRSRVPGAEVAPFPLDVREPEAVEACAHAIESRLGPVTLLVNNAAGNFVVPAAELSCRGFRSVVEIVLFGSWYCSQIFGKAMIARGSGGAILNLVATYAWTGGPGTIHSASAKAGVLAMSETLAVEWAPHRIRVNAIAPGPIERTGGAEKLWGDPERARRVQATIPLGRWGTPEEIAQLASYLLSPYASFITGACVVADGGAWLGKGFEISPCVP